MKYLLTLSLLLVACGSNQNPIEAPVSNISSQSIVTKENSTQVLSDLIQYRRTMCYEFVNNNLTNYLAECQTFDTHNSCMAHGNSQATQQKQQFEADVQYYMLDLKACILESLGEPITSTLCEVLFERSLGSTIKMTCNRGIY